jgi:sec-independent protein translocase protein TatA
MRIGPLGIWELLIILVVVLLIFGPRRLPEMAKGLGQSVREFRKGIRDMKNDFEEGAGEDATASKPASKPASQPEDTEAEPKSS